MVGLPPGWESDYDGQRWFYTYKASGHIQYHFPSEGDEFPDFVDASVPAPDLAPEERLESQQQLRRQTTTTTSPHLSKQLSPPSPHRAGNGAAKPGMSATARPVSAIWEGDGGGDEDAEQVFQPENFMFLGPGTYTEVSPLNEEEEEAARRVVAGGIGERVADDANVAGRSAVGKTVSPVASNVTTPMMQKSEASSSPAPPSAQQIVVESPPIQAEPPTTLPPQEAQHQQQPVVHMIDSREMPHELPVPPHVFDPVGVMAEMATEHTGVAHIELHPDPVEIADNSILAPIETIITPPVTGMAELPERNSPVELKMPQKPEKTGAAASGAVAAEQKPGRVSQDGAVNGHEAQTRAGQPTTETGASQAQATNQQPVVLAVESVQVHQQSPPVVISQPQQGYQWPEQQQSQGQAPDPYQVVAPVQTPSPPTQQHQYQYQQPTTVQQQGTQAPTQHVQQLPVPQPSPYVHQPQQTPSPGQPQPLQQQQQQQQQQYPQPQQPQKTQEAVQVGQYQQPQQSQQYQPPEQAQTPPQAQYYQQPQGFQQGQQGPPAQPPQVYQQGQQHQQAQSPPPQQYQHYQPPQQPEQPQQTQPTAQAQQPQKQPQYQPLPPEQGQQGQQSPPQPQPPQQPQQQWRTEWSQQTQSQPQAQPPQGDPAERFKITRKPTGGLDPQPYKPYTPGQEPADAPAQASSDKRKSNAAALQREASLMLGPKSQGLNVDPSTVPRVLSPAQVPPQMPVAGVVHQTTTQPTTPSPPVVQKAEEAKPPQESTQEPAQGLAHFPSVLKPAGNASKRNSIQGIPQQAAPSQAQPVPPSGPQPPQKSTHSVLSKFPSILKPARGKPATPGPQAPQAQTPSPGPAPTTGSGPGGQGQQPPRPLMPRQTTVPGQLPSQGPPPPGAQTQVPYHGAPPYQSAPQGPWQIQQPVRPASVMPAIGGSQPPPNQWAARYQQMAPNVQGQAPTGPVQPGSYVAQQYQQPPGRPQSAFGAPASQQGAPVAAPQGVQGSQQQLPDPAQTPPMQGVRRASTFGPGDVSPIRPRSESQSSGMPVQTPSPIEPFRRDSSNPSLPSLAQSVNGPTFTPSPATGTPASAPHKTNQPNASTAQGPPRPGKEPLEHAPGSFFPAQGPGTVPSQQSQPPTRSEQPNASLPAVKQTPVSASEYPVGYQVTAANPSQKAPAPAKPSHASQNDQEKQQPQPQQQQQQQQQQQEQQQQQQEQQQQQLAMSSQPVEQKSTPSTPGHLLGRIDEHDESEVVSEPNATPLGTRPSSIGSSLPHSPVVQRQSMQPSPAQSTVLPQPPGSTAPQGQGQPPHQGAAPGQAQQQAAHAQPQQQYHGHGQVPQMPQMPQQGMPPPGHPSQGMLPPQGQVPLHPGAMPGQHFSQQPQWAAPQGTQPAPGPSQGANSPVLKDKEKDKKWTKWFKSSKPSASPKPQQQFGQPPPGQPFQGYPNQPPPNWAPGQYAPPPGWHPSQGPPPPGFHPGMHPQYGYGPPMGGPMPPGMVPPGQMPLIPQGRHSMSDSASTSTVASAIPPHMQQHPHGQAPGQGALPNPGAPFPAGASNGQNHSRSNSNTSLPLQGQMYQTAPGQPPQPGQALKSPSEQNLMPAPLFTSQGTPHSNSGPAGGSNTGGQPGPQGQPADDKWSKKPAADYSGGDWGEDDQWQRH